MKRKKKNPYSVPAKDTKLVRIHKDLVTVLDREKTKQKRICKMKFNKNYKINYSFASKIIGGLLK